MEQSRIRNFVIIAHVDHGKSTLADRFLELTRTVERRQLREQFLDQMDLERERGITIKMQPVRMAWKSAEGEEYILNLIDTPGHVDFSYEVSRSLAAVEGAVLLVDASQGIQAQTLANYHLAKREGLAILGAVSKIDLRPQYLKEIRDEMAALLHSPSENIAQVSGKTGEGVAELLDAIVNKVPPPKGNPSQPFRALIFDSYFDPYKGVIAYVRVVDGSVRKDDTLYLLATKTKNSAIEIGIFAPELKPTDALHAGEIGYIATGIKEPGSVRVGDTITRFVPPSATAAVEPLPGYRDPQPMVFASLFSPQADDFPMLKDALGKLKLNDASFTFSHTRQEMLGQGFRIGCLGTLHLEIIKERLRREYGIEPVITLPSVKYRAMLQNGETAEIPTPQELPPIHEIKSIEEPWVKGAMLAPPEYVGSLMMLLQGSHGRATHTETMGREILISFELPLAEIIVDFYDKLKSVTRGYASLAYEIADWRPGDLVKTEILVAGRPVDAFSRIMPRSSVESWGRATIEKLKGILPRESFPVPIQAAIGTQIVARVTIPALKKDVTGHLYGGDRTRKMKLWKKQQKGKKKLAELGMGKIEIPPSVFFEIFKASSSAEYRSK